MGTSGGMSFGGGARKLDLEESDPGDLGPSLSPFSPGDLLRALSDPVESPSDLADDEEVVLGDARDDLPSLDFSRGGMSDLDGVVSLPILLHVWARRASGDFLASSWRKEQSRRLVSFSIFYIKSISCAI